MARCSGCSGDRCSCVIRAGANVAVTGAGTATNPFVITSQGQAGQSVPSGSMVMYGGEIAPAGWLMCNGSAVSRASYAALYAAVGTGYGAGDGSTTFNLPDLVGRFPIGSTAAAPYPRGSQGGSVSTVLTSTHIPQHSHSISHDHAAFTSGNDAPDHSHTYPREAFVGIGYAVGGTGALVATGSVYEPATSGASARHSHTIDVPAFSGNSGTYGTLVPTAVPTLPPYTSVNFMVKT